MGDRDKGGRTAEQRVASGVSGDSVPPYCKIGDVELDEASCEFYRSAISTLAEADVPFLLGGAYTLYQYTGVSRYTKDLDVFVRPEDVERVLGALSEAGYDTEMISEAWLAKVRCGDFFVDVIFSSGNGMSPVDDDWFKYATDGEVLGKQVKLCPPEEMIWQKAFVMTRERYDGADVAHLLLRQGKDLNWQRLLRRFDEQWHVLLSHLVLFGFIYPSERGMIPDWVMDDLLGKLETERSRPPSRRKICRGTLFSKDQYQIDLEQWGFKDARIEPIGNMTLEQVEEWDHHKD